MTASSFANLGLPVALFDNLASLGYQQMTPIQAQALPPILAGADLIGQAQTGSGKTAAFGLCLLTKLDTRVSDIQSLVLCPTRELADQVAEEIRRLARGIPNVRVLTLCGGIPKRKQTAALQHGAHIVVGTPGRVEDHLRNASLALPALTTLVLDEADRMLDMGFQDALEAIVEHLPVARQTLLFSATFPAAIQATAERALKNPVTVRVETGNDAARITEHYYRVASEAQRLTALRQLLLHFSSASTLVFCSTRQAVKEVTQSLASHGFSVLALHGELEQMDRERTLARFANRSIAVLVATDVAARGLDIDALDLVINYHVAFEPEGHVHRIGRTGRAGNSGLACTLFSDEEAHRIARLEGTGDPLRDAEPLPPQTVLDQSPVQPDMATLEIYAGRKQKLRPGDILGALTGVNGIAGDQVGKIQLFALRSYVAVRHDAIRSALRKLSDGKLKGRSYRARLLGN